MHLSPNLIFIVFFIFFSCEKSFTISKNKRVIANDYQGRTIVASNVPQKIKAIFKQYENLNIRDYDPKNIQVFPISYYLIPNEDALFLKSSQLNPRIENQLSISISGKKHFKYFIDPKNTLEYQVFKNAFHHISFEDTEFVAIQIAGENSYYLWNRNNLDIEPFIVSFKRRPNSIKREIAIENTLESIKAINNKYELYFFKETAGLIVRRSISGVNKIFNEILIQEESSTTTDSQWYSLEQLLLSANNKDSIFFKILGKSNLTPYLFVEKILIDDFYNITDRYALDLGIVFNPKLENIFLEVTADHKLTGRLGFRHYEDIYPDVISLIKHNIPSYYLKENSFAFNNDLREGRKKIIDFYVNHYLQYVIESYLSNLAKSEYSISENQSLELKKHALMSIEKIIYKNTKLKLELKSKKLKNEDFIFAADVATKFFESKEDFIIDYDEDLINYLETKIKKNEIYFLGKNIKQNPNSKYILNRHGIFETSSSNQLLSFYLFDQEESKKFFKKKGFIKLLIEKNQ